MDPMNLPAQEWQTADEAIPWFVLLRSAIRSLVHRFGYKVQEAKTIFEKFNKTNYNNYGGLHSSLEEVLTWWKGSAAKGK